MGKLCLKVPLAYRVIYVYGHDAAGNCQHKRVSKIRKLAKMCRRKRERAMIKRALNVMFHATEI